jgi:hypothetical protein
MDENEITWMASIQAESLAEFARQMSEVPYPVSASVACL